PFAGAVSAAAINDDDPGNLTRAGCRVADCLKRRGQIVTFVEDRDDDGNFHRDQSVIPCRNLPTHHTRRGITGNLRRRVAPSYLRPEPAGCGRAACTHLISSPAIFGAAVLPSKAMTLPLASSLLVAR